MRLSVIFVLTLAISVILSSCATWALTYSTSYDELQSMASGFVGLAVTAVGQFRQLVSLLISDSSALVSDLLSTQYNRSMVQMNETEQELLQTTLQLMNQTRNATTQSQTLVAALVVSFGSFMRSAIAAFTAVGTSDAAGLRQESALRAKLIFNDLIQNAATAIKRTADLYAMGMVNLSRPMEAPLDDGSCTLMGSLCFAGYEMGVDLYIGTAGGPSISCYLSSSASNRLVQRGPTADNYTIVNFVPYIPTAPGANFTQWKQPCLTDNPIRRRTSVCPKGVGMAYPNYCNGTCGYDARCRPWYSMFFTPQTPKTTMSDVYIDDDTNTPCVTLSYPIYSSSSQLVAVMATDFLLSAVDTYLATLSSTQLLAVVFNTSDLMIMGTSRACPNDPTTSASGNPLAAACDPALQALGGWLAVNRNRQQQAGNASVELGGYLWDVFPGVVESFSYFVVVGMNKSQVYAVVTATSQAANQTLQTLSQQQSARMAATQKATLAQMEQLSAERLSSLQAMESLYKQYMKQEYTRMDALFNTSRQQSAASLSLLTTQEMNDIDNLENDHLTKVKKAIGVTFGAVVGIFVGVLLGSTYSTWAVTKQVEQIAQVMEDVAQMRVEELEVTQNSPIREVKRIETSLVVLVGRLAEYKTYMPSALFQAEKEAESPPEEEALAPLSPPSGTLAPLRRKGSSQSQSSSNLRHPRGSVISSRHNTVRSVPVAGFTRLVRRSAVVMVVNVIHFRAEAAQRSAGHLEGMLNKVISAVHSTASKLQGNIEAILGDQVLVTFNAHFTCSDPCTAASNTALEVMTTLKKDGAFAWRVQIGMAVGAMYTGHLGNASFKSMVSIGAPMKVASLLSHLSGFEESAVLVCPSLEERIKYTFRLQPVDLVSLPALGQHTALYAKSITISTLEGGIRKRSQADEWLYEVGDQSCGLWAGVFQDLVKATSLEKVFEGLRQYVDDHPEDRLAARLLRRRPRWQPRVGIVLAERPDAPRGAGAPGEEEGFDLQLSPC
eukprot:EG_transcript_1808